SFPRKKVLLVSLFVYFLFFGTYLLASTLLLFAIVRTLHGAPFGSASVANSTMAIDVLPSSRRNEGIGYYGLSNNIATAIAPTVGIFVYRYFHNFDLLFWMAFAIAALGFFVNTTIQPRERQILKDKKAISLDRFFLVKGWMLAVNMICFGLCYGVLSNYLAIYGKETMGITTGTGTFFLLLSLGLILSRLQGVKALRKGRLTHNAGEGIAISTVGYALFVLVPHEVGYYGSALLIGLGNGHMWPAFQNMIISIANNNERGTANSTLLTSWDLGVGLGVLMGGFVVEFFDYTTAFWSIVAVHVVGLLLFFAATKKFFLLRMARKQEEISNS
ncbi:MAG: MFS transporter, partial [Prevotella sp.]|nr:MFS transporter [Prevotella sp.]